MKTITGDLIEYAKAGVFDVIIHGCNCFCTMDAGIAASIKSAFPEAYTADLSTLKGDRSKLGGFSFANITLSHHTVVVINAYTQFDYKSSGVKADYDAIRRVFSKLKKQYSGKRFGFPLIGAGLAGGDWRVISEIIEQAMDGEDMTLVRFRSS